MRNRLSRVFHLTSASSCRLLQWKSLFPILLWPLGGIVLAGTLWAITDSRGEEELLNARQTAFRQASALANAYAAQLSQAVHQIDQIVLNLKYDWEDKTVTVNLEKKWRRGLFPISASLYANIVDANGKLVTSSLVTGTPGDFRPKEFFQLHKSGCCDGVLISKPELSRRYGKTVIRFSHRLNKPDGSFDGVAFVAVEPSNLVSFQDEGLSGNDFVSLRLANGPLMASRQGSKEPATRNIYKSAPMFATPAGVVLEPAERFRDGIPRFVAWRKLQNYPLVTLAALSEEEVLAPYRAIVRSQRQTAEIATLLLALISLGGMYFSLRLARRRESEEDVRQTYRLATDAANEGFFMIRPVFKRNSEVDDFRIEDCNEHGAALLGKKRQDVIGIPVSTLHSREYGQEICALCKYAFERGMYESESRVPAYSPLKARWIYCRIVRSDSGLALTVRDISEAKEYEEALANLANSDALTKLPNRRWLSGFLPTAIRHAEQGDRRLAIMFIDLDNFKNINDTLGHEAGDELLQQAAHRLKQSVRASDHVVRLGGDEFTVILEHIGSTEDAVRIATAIIDTLAAPFTLTAGTGNEVSASVGISIYPQDGTDAETLLKHADIAMYAAKEAGKGRYHFYQAQLSEMLLLRMSRERALRQAVENDEFVVHYQPRVEAESGRLTSMEALVRWVHPERGIVLPTEFIDLAEDIGLIVRIGELVIDKVCAQIVQWKAQGIEPVPVSINVSPHQLKHGNISAYLAGCLARYGVPSSLVEVELTESAVIERSQTVAHELAELRRMGITLLIDDFGTGYSSLAQLHRIDVDVLKVDQAFTHALCEGVEGHTLFRAIVSMADALDMCVVAEGVETPEQLKVLRALSCDEIQGFIISRAIAANEIARFMLHRSAFDAAGIPELAPPGNG